jgi:hypothetical protein
MPSTQLKALNDAYAPYNIQFNLINVTWTTNDAWAVGEKDDDTAMKNSLRQGTYKTLSLYFRLILVVGCWGGVHSRVRLQTANLTRRSTKTTLAISMRIPCFLARLPATTAV